MKKEEFKIYAEDSIQDISHRIDELRQRANSIDDGIKPEFDEKVNHLIMKRDELKILVESFEETTEDKWEVFKKEFSNGLDLLKQGFDKLFNILSS